MKKISDKTIVKFMKRYGMKISMVPHFREDGQELSVKLKVSRDGNIEYDCVDYFRVPPTNNGYLNWLDSDLIVSVSDGIFAYLGDYNAVDNFFFSLSELFAKKYAEKNIWKQNKI